MSAMGILIILIGMWLLVNTINGNIPGLIDGTVKFNTPGAQAAAKTTAK